MVRVHLGPPMTRDKAFSILTTYLKNPNLIKHCLACEATMKELAKKFNGNEEEWGITGLLHDADYELTKETPDKHGLLLFEKEPNIPENIAHAIKSHNYLRTKVLPESSLDWAITCCDQLTGLIVAATLVLPDKKLASLTTESILKKMKDKSFAKGAMREPILLCEEKLGISLNEFVTITLRAMQGISRELEF